MWICPNCGEELSDKDVTFCGSCGSRVSAAEEVESLSEVNGGPEKGPSQYWSDEETELEDGEDEAEYSTQGKYWSDSDASEECDDESVDELQPDTNLIPEDMSALTEKLDSMMEGEYDPEAKELVTLKCFSSPEEALMVKGLLDCEGIPAMNSLNVLLVREDDLENAREILGPSDEPPMQEL